MNEDILSHVGKRIRTYRKSRGMRMEELAALVHKSKASISKYESGSVAIDLLTLSEIARVLQLELWQLVDCPAELCAPVGQFPFGKASTLYMYHMNRKIIYQSVIQLSHANEDEPLRATLFYKAPALNRLDDSNCIYHGRMSCHSTVLNFLFSNYHNAAETALLNFFIPMRKSDALVGMFSGMGSNTIIPSAQKTLLASRVLEMDEALQARLVIAPESLKEMKRTNSLFIPLAEE